MDTRTEALRLAIFNMGTATKMAEALGVKPSSITEWKVRGVPATRVLEIERLTGVSRHKLRPDVYGEEE